MKTTDPIAPAPNRSVWWVVYPKLVAIAVLLGSFVCTLVLILATPRSSLEDWRPMVNSIGILFKLLIVPASFVVVVLSLVLFFRNRQWFLRQRWAQVKVLLLVATLPALHLLARSVFTSIRQEVEREGGSPEGPTGRLEMFTLLVAVTIVVLLLAIWLARFKPRLGSKREA